MTHESARAHTLLCTPQTNQTLCAGTSRRQTGNHSPESAARDAERQVKRLITVTSWGAHGRQAHSPRAPGTQPAPTPARVKIQGFKDTFQGPMARAGAMMIAPAVGGSWWTSPCRTAICSLFPSHRHNVTQLRCCCVCWRQLDCAELRARQSAQRYVCSWQSQTMI